MARMTWRRYCCLLLLLALLATCLSVCGGSVGNEPASEEPGPEETVATEEVPEQGGEAPAEERVTETVMEVTREAEGDVVVTTLVEGQEMLVSATPRGEEATRVPTPVPSFPAPTLQSTPAPAEKSRPEEHMLEVEWPATMRLGDSALIRLSLLPASEGYIVTTEFPDHSTESQPIAVAPREGYTLAAVARLEGVGLRFVPEGEPVKQVTPGAPVPWRWSLQPVEAGRHRLFISLSFRWTPLEIGRRESVQTEVWSYPLEIEVRSIMGLTIRQVTTGGLLGLLAGSMLMLPMMAYLLRPRAHPRLRRLISNPHVLLAGEADIVLEEERKLLRALFNVYEQVILHAEFRSGYSGARVFLVRPVYADGRADAYTIIKLGEQCDIAREYTNYGTFVKDTLPPVTARIQEPPAVVWGEALPLRREGREATLAALRYTFVGEQGQLPVSLAEALGAGEGAERLEKRFRIFAPNWWLQRGPFVFRLSEEYDRNLPAHYVLEPAPRRTARGLLDGAKPPAGASWQVGNVVRIRNMTVVERRPDRGYLSLAGEVVPGHPPLRVRWLDLEAPGEGRARVVATRESLLREATTGLDLFGLPDPLERLPALLDRSLSGMRSIVHGDLNLQNILVGPGDLVWLIDFARTREGHTLSDFAHLEAEVIAHVLAPRLTSPEAYLALREEGNAPLLTAIHAFAERCLFNPDEPQEYYLALCLTSLGAMKYVNLSPFSRHLLYLTAAHTLAKVEQSMAPAL